jgi:hypothetical protein
MTRWRVYPRLGRVSNLPTIATQTAAGIAITDGRPDAFDVLAVGGGLAASYVAGMFLNDAFDRRIDAQERPDRPIPSGQVAAREVFVAGGALLAAGGALLVLAGARHGRGALTLLVTVALAGAIVLYDAHHKGSAFAPVVMGACRGLVYLCAAASLASEMPGLSFVAATAMTAYVAGLSEVARAPRMPPLAAAVPLLAAPVALAMATFGRSSVGATLGALALVVVIVHAFQLARRGSRERATITLLAGMSLIDAVLLAWAGHPLLALAAAAALPVTRALQSVVRGT